MVRSRGLREARSAVSAPVTFLIEARSDIDQAYQRYEGYREGLGQRFLDKLEDRMKHVCDFPEAYAVIDYGVRAAPLKKFPYIVYYRYENEHIFVIGVIYCYRDSHAWKRRL